MVNNLERNRVAEGEAEKESNEIKGTVRHDFLEGTTLLRCKPNAVQNEAAQWRVWLPVSTAVSICSWNTKMNTKMKYRLIALGSA
jgi:hypothetical protein